MLRRASSESCLPFTVYGCFVSFVLIRCFLPIQIQINTDVLKESVVRTYMCARTRRVFGKHLYHLYMCIPFYWNSSNSSFIRKLLCVHTCARTRGTFGISTVPTVTVPLSV